MKAKCSFVPPPVFVLCFPAKFETMWAIKNKTAYATERSWTRDKQGMHHWLVVVQATFNIAPGGRLALVDDQPPPLQEPEYHGDPAKSSLRLDADLLSPKPGTDVVLDASAYAPAGRPARQVDVSLRIGELEKTLLVFGPRVYRGGLLGLKVSAPQPFAVQPIRYEWAVGGADTSHPDPRRHTIDMRNPVGKGAANAARTLDGQPAHAIEYPGTNPFHAGPAGFGPIASFWSPRREQAGTYDQQWEQLRRPLLPDDYDEHFALSAPADQRLTQPLRGGELVQLRNLTAEGELCFQLPRIFLAFRTYFGDRSVEHRATLTTVFIATEERKLKLIWQSALRVPMRDADYLDTTLIWEKHYL